MPNMFKTPHKVMLYREKAEDQEFGRAKKHYQICSVCHAVYLTKSWHHINGLHPRNIVEGSSLHVTLCPACRMIMQHHYEGVLHIRGIPTRLDNHVSSLIKSYTARAYEKDCQHRIVDMVRTPEGHLVVTTTENQLAQKLAQKIKDSFHHMNVHTKHSRSPDDATHITMTFSHHK